MATTIIVLGHGGGVAMAPVGNTNFAILPEVGADEVNERATGSKTWGQVVHEMLQRYRFWLVDCGPETALRICNALEPQFDVPAPIQQLQGIFLTHCHTDHSGGLPTVAWRTRFIEDTQPALYVGTACVDMLQQQLVELDGSGSPGLIHQLRHSPTAHDYFTFTTCGDRVPTQVHGSAGMQAIYRTVDHNIFRPVQNDLWAFPGYSVALVLGDDGVAVFSGDTAFPLHASCMRDATVTFHDCQFHDAGGPSAVHCPFRKLADEVSPAERGNVWLSHCTVAAGSEAVGSGFNWAKQGSIIVLDRGELALTW